MFGLRDLDLFGFYDVGVGVDVRVPLEARTVRAFNLNGYIFNGHADIWSGSPRILGGRDQNA